jgi:hypothetical protein
MTTTVAAAVTNAVKATISRRGRCFTGPPVNRFRGAGDGPHKVKKSVPEPVPNL